jgi:hypothetical protein
VEGCGTGGGTGHGSRNRSGVGVLGCVSLAQDGTYMISRKALDGYREWLRQKGVTGLPDSEVERFVKSTRKKMLFWTVVILGVLLLTAVVVWRDLH